MDEQLTVITVRALLTHFRSTLQTAQQTGEPIIIALRHRTPAGVLLGYEAWQALAAGQPPVQADTATLRAELAAERRRSTTLAAELAAARRQIEETGHDLTAVRQRVAEREAQLAGPQPADSVGAGWGLAPQPEPPAIPLGAWASQPWGNSNAEKPPAKAQ